MRRLAILLAAAALLLVACGSGDDDSSDTTVAGGDTATTAEDSSGSTEPADLPAYDTVAEIGADLSCDLEYDGIVDAEREYSTCVFEGEQALIYIYTDPTVITDIANAGAPALAYGANWTVEVATQPVAESVAAATGGAVADPGGA
jgi:hypothetical protein